MKRLAVMLCASSMMFGAGSATGRWDLTVTPKNGGAAYPDWLELADNGGKTMLRVQPRSGGARQISEFQATGSHLHFVFSAADQKNPEVVWDLEASGDRITGTITRGGTVSADVAGVRAPALDRKPPAEWSAAEPIFNGKDLTGWEPMTPNNNHWT